MTFSGVLIAPSRLSSGWNLSQKVQKRYPDPAIVTLDKRFEKYIQSNSAVERLWTGGRLIVETGQPAHKPMQVSHSIHYMLMQRVLRCRKVFIENSFFCWPFPMWPFEIICPPSSRQNRISDFDQRSRRVKSDGEVGVAGYFMIPAGVIQTCDPLVPNQMR